MITDNVVENLTQLLESWGPNGEHWCIGLHNYNGDSFCILGGIGKLESGKPGYPMTLNGHMAQAAISREVGDIISFNDYQSNGNFYNIKAAVCRAIRRELAQEEAKLEAAS